MKKPIENLIDKSMKCTKCGAGMGKCDCWEECSCGWTFEKGKKCGSPIHKIKKIEFASSKKVDKYDKFSEEFLKKIFGIKSFLISDESSIYDFDCSITEKGVVHRTEKILKKIEKVYGVDVSKVKGLRLYKIFDLIKRSFCA